MGCRGSKEDEEVAQTKSDVYYLLRTLIDLTNANLTLKDLEKLWDKLIRECGEVQPLESFKCQDHAVQKFYSTIS